MGATAAAGKVPNMAASPGSIATSELGAPRALEPRRKSRREAQEPLHHTWTRSSVTLIGKRKKGNKHSPTHTPLDLRPFRLHGRSLLKRLLHAIPVGTHASTLSTFCRAISELKDNPEAKAVLRAPPEALTTWDIRELFIAIEDVVSKWPKDSQYEQSTSIRAVFPYFQGRLKDGSQIGERKFETRFSIRSKGTKNDEYSNGESSSLEFLDDFDTLQERNKKVLRDSIDRQEHILEACEMAVLEHERAKFIVRTARSAGLPDLKQRHLNSLTRGEKPDRNTFKRWTPDERLRIILYLLDNRVTGWLPYRSLTQFEKLLDSDSAPKRFELVICDRFLPRLVVVAHAIAILTITALNPNVLYSLTRENIYVQAGYVIVTGLKGRTDGKVEIILNDRDAEAEKEKASEDDAQDSVKVVDKRAVDALKELVQNSIEIESAFNLRSVPLICGLDYTAGTAHFYVFNVYKEAQRLWKHLGRDSIDLRSLRPLAARKEYLSPGGSIYSVKALLNHKDIQTSVEYVNTKIVAALHRANIRRFMKKIEATALFRFGREDQFAERGLNRSDIQPPLFPVVESLSTRSLVDDWNARDDGIKIEVGTNQLAHCVRQLKYYKKSFERLISDNAPRFVEVHFPRMLFCLAITEYVAKGPHNAILKRIERELA